MWCLFKQKRWVPLNHRPMDIPEKKNTCVPGPLCVALKNYVSGYLATLGGSFGATQGKNLRYTHKSDPQKGHPWETSGAPWFKGVALDSKNVTGSVVIGTGVVWEMRTVLPVRSLQCQHVPFVALGASPNPQVQQHNPLEGLPGSSDKALRNHRHGT